MTEERLGEIESRLLDLGESKLSAFIAGECDGTHYGVSLSSGEGYRYATRFKTFVDDEEEFSVLRGRCHALADFCGHAQADVAELLAALREAQEANAGEYARGVEAAADIAKRIRCLGEEAVPKDGRASVWTIVEKIGEEIEKEIRALLPADAPTEGEG